MARLLALAAALIAGLILAWWEERPPRPRPADAPRTAFSAARAMQDVEQIAAQPHPIGTPANAQVRDYIIRRMAELGLAPQIRRGTGVFASDGFVAGAPVENIVGILPGRDRTKPAVALMSHYDSAPASPGAADDAAGVAASLEIVRALQARGIPERDVMVVVTDGEEAGLLGAEAFFARDPLARRIGLLINMEARGNAGRVQMFETGHENGGVIDLFRRTAVRPAANSLSVFIYERMPNGTDFTKGKAIGLPGLNYAFVGRQFDYHSPTATAANLDPGSLQDLGTQVLSVAAAAAFSERLPARRPDVVYSDLFGDLIVAYPAWVGWLVLAAAGALVAHGARRARRIAGFAWMEAARGAAAFLFGVLGGIAVLHLARKATGTGFGWFEQRELLAQVTRWETALLLLGSGFLLLAAAASARGRRAVVLIPLLAGLAASAFGGLDLLALGLAAAAAVLGLFAYRRPASRPGAWTGVLLAGLVLGVVAQAIAPPTAYVIAWPLLLAAIAGAATAMAAGRGLPCLLLLAMVAAAALGWIGGLAHAAFLSLDAAWLLALPLALAALVLWPLAQPAEGAPPARLLGPVFLAAGAALVLVIRYDEPWTARHPEASLVLYHLDQDAGRAWRVSATPDSPAWSRAVLAADGGVAAERRHWFWRTPVTAAPARPVEEPAPEIVLTDQPDGAMLLRAVPPPGARILILQLNPSVPVAAGQVSGAPVDVALEPGTWTRVLWYGGPEGVEIRLRPAGPGALEVRYGAVLDRWPPGAQPLPERPADVMPFDISDATLVTGTRRLTW